MRGATARFGILGAFVVLAAASRATVAAEVCKLLTTDEIARTLGTTVSNTMPISTGACIWTTPSGKVSLTLKDAKDPSVWERVTTPVPGMTKSRISGLGDAAQTTVFGERGNGKHDYATLSVKQGTEMITVGINGTQGADKQSELEQALARLVLKRL